MMGEGSPSSPSSQASKSEKERSVAEVANWKGIRCRNEAFEMWVIWVERERGLVFIMFGDFQGKFRIYELTNQTDISASFNLPV